MTNAQPYRKGSLTGQCFDVIVIGSGIGGLCAAALLSKAGRRVLVLERHFVAGGFTHTFRRRNFEWDIGVHYIGEVHRKRSLPRRVFDEIADGSLEWSRMPEVYERIFFPDRTYEFSAGLQNFKSRLVEYFPREEAAINRYICLVNEVRNAAPAYFTEKSMPPWLGRLAWRFMGTEFMKYATSTTREVISGLTSNPKFLGVLTAQYGDYGLPPGQSSFAIHALLVRHYMDGGGYPVGGASSIFRAICPVIERGGGMVMINAEVEKILTASKRAIGVMLRNGDEIRARAVISDAGVVNTFGTLVAPEIRRSLGLDAMLDQVRPAVSHNCLYVGLDSSAQTLDLNPSNCWIYPEYDHDENVRRFLADRLAPLPVTYISFPSAKDPDWNRRHPGKSTIEVLSYAPHEWFRQWEGSKWRRRGSEYEAHKAELSERLLQQLYACVPAVKGKVAYHELSTPLSTAHFSNHAAGAIYGIEHTPERFKLRWLRPHTPIRNLFLTGQDIVTGGVVGALFSGVVTASAILQRNLLKDIVANAAG